MPEIATIEQAAGLVSAVTASIMSTSFMTNSFLSAPLNGLWGLLDSIQIVAFLPLFELLRFPSNAATMNRGVALVANFDIINTEEWVDNPYILDKGEEYSFSGTFEECGFESTQFLSNSSFMAWCYIFNFAFFIIY